MKKYKVTLQHDKGKSIVYYLGSSEDEVREIIKMVAGCPDRAILKMEIVPYYVTMTDKFMSGWGKAEGKTNKFIIQCDTWQDAEIIEKNARKRNEMKYINITDKKPRYGRNVIESWKTFEELGQIWKQN